MDLLLVSGDNITSINDELNIVNDKICAPKQIYITDKIYKKLCKKQKYDELYALLTDNIIKYRDIDSILYLGSFYRKKNTQYYDLDKSLKYIKLSTELCNTSISSHIAQYCMGNIYKAQVRLSADKDSIKQMITWYKRSAYNGYAPAMFYIGKLYYSGAYLKINKKKGIEWLKKSASFNNINALNKLGDIMLKCNNFTASYSYYKRSHDLGNIIGTRNIAIYFLTGKGVNQDLIQGKILMNKYFDETKDDSLMDIYMKEVRINQMGILYYFCN